MFPVLQFFHSFHSKGMSCQDAWRLGKANKFVLLSASAIFGLRPFILLRLGKANKFVLLSASAYICPTFRIFNLKY